MDLLKGNVRQIYFRYLGAAFGSALISSIYGLVDSAMVGQYQGPEGTAALAIVAVVAVAAVGFAGHMIAHHVGGFYARIEEEDERARMEEEQAAKKAAQEGNHQTGETQ